MKKSLQTRAGGPDEVARSYASRAWEGARRAREREAKKFQREKVVEEFALMCQGRFDDLRARGLLHSKRAWAQGCGAGLSIRLSLDDGGERMIHSLVLFVRDVRGDVLALARYAGQRALFAIMGKKRFFEWKWRAVEEMLAAMDAKLANEELGVEECAPGVAAWAEGEELRRAAAPAAGTERESGRL